MLKRTGRHPAPTLDSAHSRWHNQLAIRHIRYCSPQRSPPTSRLREHLRRRDAYVGSSALCLAIIKSQHGNIIGSIITFYMIATAWLAGRRRAIGRLDLAALVVGTGGAVAVITLGIWTLHHPDKNAPAGLCFFLAAVLLLAAAGDIRMLARGGISGRPRVTRHLWRMCFGLFFATGSFFLGQQQVFPAFLRGSVFLTVLALLPFPLMIYWLIRVRFSNAYKVQPQASSIAVAP